MEDIKKSKEEQLLDYLNSLDENHECRMIVIGAGLEDILSELVIAKLKELNIKVMTKDAYDEMSEVKELVKPKPEPPLIYNMAPRVEMPYDGDLPRRGKGSWESPHKFHK